MSTAKTSVHASLPFRVRRSPIHGTGVFATRAIPKGARIIEYLGERVSHAEADRRYEDKDLNDNHTFLFTVDSRTVIDAGVDGSDARWINHSCDPNCETVIENKRVYIEAARDIPAGAELAYDYMISREPSDPPDIEKIFACRCGSANCRGTMLLPPAKKKRKQAKTSAKSKSKSKSKSKTRTRTKTKAKAKAKAAAKPKPKPKPKPKAKGRAVAKRKGGASGAKRRARA